MEAIVKKDKYSVKHYPSKIVSHKRQGNFFWFYTGETILEVRVVSDKIIRFRYAADGFFQKDFSYGLAEDFRDVNVKVKLKEDSAKYEIITTALVCHISKKNMKTVMYNRSKKVIMEDELGFHWQYYIQKGGKINYCSKKIQEGEHF